MRTAIQTSPIVQTLRGLEPYAYQVAYFILQDGKLAEEAAKAALIELSRTGKLVGEPAEELRSRIKKLTISAAIATAGSAASIR